MTGGTAASYYDSYYDRLVSRVRQPRYVHVQLMDAIRQIAGIVNVPIEGSNLSTLEIEIASKMGAFKDQLAGIIGNIRTIDFNFLGMNLARTPEFFV